MVEQQATVTEFATGDTDVTAESITEETADQPSETTVLFRWSDDPFVNEAAAEVGRQLENEFQESVVITPTTIKVADSIVEEVVEWLRQIFDDALADTHRRSTIAHQVNAVVGQVGEGSSDDRWISPPTTYFPDRLDEDLTIYPDDEVSTDDLVANNLPAEEVDYIDDDGSRAFELSPAYVGHPSWNNFRHQISRFERYLDTYLDWLADEFEADEQRCMNCGSEDVPAYKGVEGKNLEFNQSFNILAGSSSVSTPLGMGGRTSKHGGRCIACLLAGFYYTLMPKVVRFNGTESRGGSRPVRVYRIFTPRGDFEELVQIRSDFQTDLLNPIDAPTDYAHVRRGTLPATSTPSRGLQTLQLYETVLRHVSNAYSTDPYEFAVEYQPTALTSYVSAPEKSGRPIRDISSVEAIDPEAWAYDAVRQRTLPVSTGSMPEYWPFADVLDWYAQIDDAPVGALDDIAHGILDQDLKRLARGHFEIAKTLEQDQGESAQYIPPIERATHYFITIMQAATATTGDDRIDEETIESIKRVASNLGEIFYERDDISVLISLQNATTPEEFLEAFEKASMQAQKKASAEGGSSTWSGQNDVAQVLKHINNPDTFEPTKRMFVIHASLSAQYMNAQRSSEDDDQ